MGFYALHGVECDSCGDDYGDTSDSKESLITSIIMDGWEVDMTFETVECPDCCYYDEEDEEDD